MGVDPVGFDEKNLHSFNRYAYANNNPYTFVDPDGRIAETAIDIVSFGLAVQAYRHDPSLLNAVGVAYDGIATVVPILPAGFGIIRNAGRAADALNDTVHANSLLSEKAQHLYEIYRTNADGTATVVKTGISSGKMTKDGESSYRATRQINKWVSEGKAEKGELQQRIVGHVDAGPGARQRALGLEKANADRLRGQGQGHLEERFHARP